MLIGRLNKRIQLQAFVDKKWVTQQTIWAEFKTPTYKTETLAGNVASELTREINIRYNTTVKKGWRVVWENKIFDIKHTFDYQKTATVLVCLEVVL